MCLTQHQAVQSILCAGVTQAYKNILPVWVGGSMRQSSPQSKLNPLCIKKREKPEGSLVTFDYYDHYDFEIKSVQRDWSLLVRVSIGL